MKLTIDFQIKDGKRIISRDTKGYKVLLNRIVKQFAGLTDKSSLTYKVIIQMSAEGGQNKSGMWSKYLGQIYYNKRTIYVYYANLGSYENNKHDKVLEIIGHEFGHLYDAYHYGFNQYDKIPLFVKENRADKFAVKVTQKQLISASATATRKYAREK